MPQVPPGYPLNGKLRPFEKGYIPNPYRFQCFICLGLLDCRETHTLYVNGQRAHNVCVQQRAEENARKQQSSMW